jgi:hypothetical protein
MEAEGGFHRIKGFDDLPALLAALNAPAPSITT